jgi:hypothetical protein
MENKTKIGIGVLVLVGVGYYFYNKSKSPMTNVTTNLPKPSEPILTTLPVINQLNTNKKFYPQKINNVTQTLNKGQGSYDNAIIPKNTVIEDVRIVNSPLDFGGSFQVNKLNDFDGGGTFVDSYNFDIIEVTDISYREKVDKVLTPYAVDRIFEKNGYKVGAGDIVKIKLNQDVKRSIPNKVIFYT